jgi:hypothetical protein
MLLWQCVCYVAKWATKRYEIIVIAEELIVVADLLTVSNEYIASY